MAAEEALTRVRVGSRSSELAMIQTKTIVAALQKCYPEVEFTITTMSTIGDKIQDRALQHIGSTNLFTKELEFALVSNEIDMIVHSLKDVPTTLSPDLYIAVIYKRDDPTDAVLMSPKNSGKTLQDLPPGSVIGTSSLRRIAQLRRNCPHLQFKTVRGNLNTRLRKLEEERDYASLVLATSGVERMGWQNKISQKLDPSFCLYAVGQGALGVETRRSDSQLIKMLSCLNDADTVVSCCAERAFLHILEGGCSVPVGVHSSIKEGTLKIHGAVFSLDGSKKLEHCIAKKLSIGWAERSFENLCAEGSSVGQDLAKVLLSQGAKSILVEAKSQSEQMSNPQT